MSELQPVALQRIGPDESGLLISWSDGSQTRHTASALREACPCATCREKKAADAPGQPLQLPVLSMAEARPLGIQGMRPVGNYAYNIAFSDGHDSGIYTFEYLHRQRQPS